MYKLFAFVGSPRGINSHSYKITKELFNKIQSYFSDEIEFDIFTSDRLNINKCKGCTNCFFVEGKCVQFIDDMNMLEKKMLESNLIIFASPVYLHNVTGDMKVFLDRISYWSHIFRLVGKYGISITSSSSNGNNIVDYHLKTTMEYFGISHLGSINYSQSFFEDGIISSLAFKVSEVLNKKCKIPCSELQQIAFESYRQHFNIIGEKYPNNIEYLYWKNNNYFNHKTFESLFLENSR